MGQVHINYTEVQNQTSALRSNINSDILKRVENEYRQIQSMLNGVDGATNAKLKEAIDANLNKTIKVARTLEKLLSFMANSSKQVELNERKIAADIKAKK